MFALRLLQRVFYISATRVWPFSTGLFAKRHNGVFVLRIEDTDIARSEKDIQPNSSKTCAGSAFPGRKGLTLEAAMPLISSQSGCTYTTMFVRNLLQMGWRTGVTAHRKPWKNAGKSPGYRASRPGTTTAAGPLTDKQTQAFEASQSPYTIRFKVPDEQIVFEDLIRGTCQFDMSLTGDFVIMRSDATPSFHLAVAVDDTLMDITHVIRGEDHLSNTPCHLLLFHALKQKPPQFAHLSLTMGADRSLLSKRHGASSISEYRKLGYLPEALLNYMMLLGWAPKDKKEKFNVDDVIDTFEISSMSKSSAIFDQQKLDWISGQYMREADIERLTDLAIPYLQTAGFVSPDNGKIDRNRVKSIVDAVRGNIACMSQIGQEADIFLRTQLLVKTTSHFCPQRHASPSLQPFMRSCKSWIPYPLRFSRRC